MERVSVLMIAEAKWDGGEIEAHAKPWHNIPWKNTWNTLTHAMLQVLHLSDRIVNKDRKQHAFCDYPDKWPLQYRNFLYYRQSDPFFVWRRGSIRQSVKKDRSVQKAVLESLCSRVLYIVHYCVLASHQGKRQTFQYAVTQILLALYGQGWMYDGSTL